MVNPTQNGHSTQAVGTAQAFQVRSSGHDNPVEFRNVFWMNFTQTLIWKLEILKSIWLLPINSFLVTL